MLSTYVAYDEWKKVPIVIKSKNGESKECKCMKVVKEVKNKGDFQDYFINEAIKFREHAERVSSQYQAKET